MPSVVRKNFVVAVWLSVVLCVLLVAVNWPDGDPGRFAPQRGNVYFGLVVALLQMLLWFFYYRDDEEPIAAASMGAFLALPLVTTGIADAVNSTRNVLEPEFLALAYLSVSHIVYAYFHWRGQSRTWLDP